MTKEAVPVSGQEPFSLTDHRTPLPASPIITLLGISAALLLGVGYMLFETPPMPTQHAANSDAPHLAPAIAGKTEIQLRADLVRVKQELEQARAEQQETLQAIKQVSQELEQKMKAASLAGGGK